MSEFLNKEVCIKLRDTVNESNLFNSDAKYRKEYFNLICASMDRLDSAVNYLNDHTNYPKTEEEFIFFLTYADMIIESVTNLCNSQNIESTYKEDEENLDNYKFFGDVEMLIPKYLEVQKSESDKVTNFVMKSSDSKFFKYIRALALAHFCGTNRHPKFLKKGETQYSPYVIANHKGSFLRGIESPVGVKIYSDLSDNSISILFSFKKLMEFVKSRYMLLELVSKHNLKLISDFDIESKKRKVTRTNSIIEIFKEIKNILEERYHEDIDLKECISILEYKTANILNKKSVRKLCDDINNNIDLICDAVDNLEYEEVERLLRKTIYLDSEIKYDDMGYKFEKIFGCEDIECAKCQAKLFSEQFAKKWVNIDVEKMEIEEIRILCRVACYLEAKELEK